MREYSSNPEGAVRTPTPFKLDGVEFNGAVSFLDILPLADFADINFDANGQLPPEAAKAMTSFFEVALGDDYKRFAAHIRSHGTKPLVLMQVLMDLMEDATQGLFPTQPSSSSPDGDGPIAPLSTDAYNALTDTERTQVQAVAMMARMRLAAAAEFGTEPPPLPPGVVPTEGSPQLLAAIKAALAHPDSLPSTP